jgi:hypothetical protein
MQWQAIDDAERSVAALEKGRTEKMPTTDTRPCITQSIRVDKPYRHRA